VLEASGARGVWAKRGMRAAGLTSRKVPVQKEKGGLLVPRVLRGLVVVVTIVTALEGRGTGCLFCSACEWEKKLGFRATPAHTRREGGEDKTGYP
jgi:hypothetical protein